LDHCGRLPILENKGFMGDVYMTTPTADLAMLSLLDSAKIAKEDHPERILYDKETVYKFINRFRVVNYGQTFTVSDFKITLRDAGHILGSSSVEVAVDGQIIVFSGDLGNTPEDLTKPTELIKSADIVVIESTYGGRVHPPGEPEEMIQREINLVEQTGGTLLIPAFSLERTQELLHIISHLKSQGQIRAETPVFLDSPMAEKATNIYEKHKSFLNAEIRKDFMTSDPFSFPGLQVCETRKDSASLDIQNGVKVIIAGAGMMTGGRIVGHAKALLDNPHTRLLIVGYQGEQTLGREILMGERDVNIDGQRVHINATVTDIQVMSSHADQPKLMNWLKAIRGVRKVIITHGEDGPRHILSGQIKADLSISDIAIPHLDEEIDLSLRSV
ncbi:MAG: MBL fold metallo-hydrolase, partial [Bacteroidales bacterium]|jgi:metallo-beta-lactamase family protein